MKTNTELEIFSSIDVNSAPNLTNAALERIATGIAELPEFPSRLSQTTRIAFSRACFTLACRVGNGMYDISVVTGANDEVMAVLPDAQLDAPVGMHEVWESYVTYFCPDGQMSEHLVARLGKAGTLLVEQLESETSVAWAEQPLVQARQQVAAAYNDLP